MSNRGTGFCFPAGKTFPNVGAAPLWLCKGCEEVFPRLWVPGAPANAVFVGWEFSAATHAGGATISLRFGQPTSVLDFPTQAKPACVGHPLTLECWGLPGPPDAFAGW